jgi:hypothetical protein
MWRGKRRNYEESGRRRIRQEREDGRGIERKE